MDISRYSRGRYLAAKDLPDTPTLAKIESTHLTEIEGQDRVVLVTSEGAIILNKTNLRSLEESYGSTETDDWVGKRVKIVVEETTYSGKRVDCIRVYGPPAKPETPAKPEKELRPLPTPKRETRPAAPVADDDIPF